MAGKHLLLWLNVSPLNTISVARSKFHDKVIL